MRSRSKKMAAIYVQHRVEVHIDALRTSAATVRAEFRVLEHGQG